jgi:hypothetical protein
VPFPFLRFYFAVSPAGPLPVSPRLPAPPRCTIAIPGHVPAPIGPLSTLYALRAVILHAANRFLYCPSRNSVPAAIHSPRHCPSQFVPKDTANPLGNRNRRRLKIDHPSDPTLVPFTVHRDMPLKQNPPLPTLESSNWMTCSTDYI